MDDENIEVIGIDHGWSNIKTVSEIFVSGVKEIQTEPYFKGNLIEYGGRYYKVGGQRTEVKENKVSDQDYYLLTLAAVAKELKRRGKRRAKVILAVGLPLTKFGQEKADFIRYLTRNPQLTYKFENETYFVEIVRVYVFPQCYAAVADKLPKTSRKQLVVDIGSWTIDMMPISNGTPEEEECDTIEEGLITCIGNINAQCVRKLNGKIDENDIIEIMCGRDIDIDNEYKEIIKREVEQFAAEIYKKINAHGYNLQTTSITFVGGGATVMRIYGKKQQKNIKYIEDIHANAKGFEYLGRMFGNMRRGGKNA